jgi:hypothetical protein
VSDARMEWDRARQEFKARLARREALAKDYQDGQLPNMQNVVLVAKRVIAALQAARLLPTG